MNWSETMNRSRLPFPPPGDIPDPRIEPASPLSLESLALAGRFFTTEPARKPNGHISCTNLVLYPSNVFRLVYSLFNFFIQILNFQPFFPYT